MEPGNSQESGMSRVLDNYGVHHRETHRWQTVRCPNPDHTDRHRSARVNIEEDAFCCLGCGIKGTSIDLIMSIEGVSRDSAYTIYQSITGGGHQSLRKDAGNRRRGIDISGRTRDYERGSELFSILENSSTTWNKVIREHI